MAYYEKKEDCIILKRHFFLILFSILKYIFLLLVTAFLYLIWFKIEWFLWDDINAYIKYIDFIFIFVIINYAFFRFILHLIEYYHDLIIVQWSNVVIIKSSLILKNDIESIDSYRIMKIDSFSRWFLSNVFWYWKLVIEQEKDDVRTFSFIPKPDRILSIIKKYKEIAIEKRKKNYIFTKNEDIDN